MYFRSSTLDDLLHQAITELLALPISVKSTRGNSSELLGVMLHLENPLARLSRTETKGKPFSAIGELLWYLSASDDANFISYYIEAYKDETVDGKTIHGAYGPRLFNFRNQYNQVQNVLDILRRKPSTRQAVIQLLDASDIAAKRKEVPCTCTLQFFVREQKLHMLTHMRSNDAFKGLPHDVFAFTMMQEMLARELSLQLGDYKHFVGSLHLYESDINKAKEYLSEGYQSASGDLFMPSIPDAQPLAVLPYLLEVEQEIRNGNIINLDNINVNDYWKDIIRLLLVFRLIKNKNKDKNNFHNIIEEMNTDVYNTYIYKRVEAIERHEQIQHRNRKFDQKNE
ncbi:thymidylate synthase [Hymenobacter wooponensis]|uniref:thymidylate synthase n=1 Tax=Hymenobacter wooponensis TaxID=1525360 RepID=A0A4Z0MFS9_9BACT|nr:thymidylate synthase [Hymenobacter wooponensis]TGD78227.1 thymidylate synthase [Hymenobacter wooponensis]